MPRPLLLAALAATLFAAFWPWLLSPTEGLDRGHNALWLSHGWMGDATWFSDNDRDPEAYDPATLADRVARLRVDRAYPHLCPTDNAGHLPGIDPARIARLREALPDTRILPWIGGVNSTHVFLADPSWRATFVAEATALVLDHDLDGVHLNVEPLPDGDPHYLLLLEELRAALPDHRLSVAAYPPHVLPSQALEVHWSKDYFAEVASRVDEVAVMTYDSGMVVPGAFALVVARWAQHVRAATGTTEVLFGVPTYDDEWMTWHWPSGEHLTSGLAGLWLVDHGPAYRGIAIYANWELDDDEVAWLERSFVRPDHPPPPG